MKALLATWRRLGLHDGTEAWVITHFARFWRALRRTPVLRSMTNRWIINRLIYKMKTRPGAFSTMSPYTSWESLTDRTFSNRHLPQDLTLKERTPTLKAAAELFQRDGTAPIWSDKSTLLFPFFAQWFTDGFLRTDPENPLKNTSTHDIDLSQLYGQDPEVTAMLRSHVGGRLRSQPLARGEYPAYYFGPDGNVKSEFVGLPIIFPGRDRKGVPEHLPPERVKNLFALGIPRGNIHYGFAMMSTLFLREHNRLAGLIAAEHANDRDWDDDRIFETTRNTLIAILLKVVIEDYINHITPFYFDLFVRPGIGAGETWFRQNWMAIEFNLLYRWHTLVPTNVQVGTVEHRMEDLLWDNSILLAHDLGDLFDEASRQRCASIGLFNTDEFLLPIECRTIDIGRTADLASYNAYRTLCGYRRAASFDDVSANPRVQSALASRYQTVDDVEFYVGLFAEDVAPNAALPPLMGTMVAVDAFSQALTNPLLARDVFGAPTFSAAGMDAYNSTRCLRDVVVRNVAMPDPLVTFTQPSWRPS